MEKGVLYLIDKNQKIIPLFEQEAKKWKLLAASGGHLINVFGEWSGDRLLLLSLTINQTYISL